MNDAITHEGNTNITDAGNVVTVETVVQNGVNGPGEDEALTQLSELEMPAKKDAASQLMEMVEGMNFFHDETKRAFVQISRGGHKEIVAVKGDEFKYWLRYQYFVRYQDIVTSEALKKTLDTLVGKALFAGERYQLQVRVAEYAGDIWYDLSNDGHQAVRITPDIWTVENEPPIMFQRFRKSGAQVTPEGDGDVKNLLSFVNMADPGQQCLLLTYLIYCFVPGVPKPLLLPHGEKGSGKTTLSRVIKMLVDPSNVDTSSLPANKAELVLQLAQTYMPVYDNQVALTQCQSDVMCCAATGGGLIKKELYTDAGEILYRFVRPVIINGINEVAVNSDLLDRCILVEQERISDNERITEKEFWERFRVQRPKILGGIFNTLSQAMRVYPSIRLDSLPRMADFAIWGSAIAQAMGYNQKVFLDAYAQNMRLTNRAAIDSHPLALTLIRMIHDRPVGFGATAAKLLQTIERVAESEGIRTDDKQFPKTAAVLVRRLREVKSNLRAEGFDYAVERDAKNNSVVRIFPIQSQETSA